jgi:nucleolar MIF4G domain-containing protein 1
MGKSKGILKLPKIIHEHVKGSSEQRKFTKLSKKFTSRKEIRKLQRNEKKQKRIMHNMRFKNSRDTIFSDSEDYDQEEMKDNSSNISKAEPSEKKVTKTLTLKDALKGKGIANKDSDDIDEEIALLESRLGDQKKLQNELKEDGLDDLCGFLDQLENGELQNEDNDDSSEKIDDADEDSQQSDSVSSDQEEDPSVEMEDGSDDCDSSEQEIDDEERRMELLKKSEMRKKKQEFLYGGGSDETASSQLSGSSKYIPPQLRASLADSGETRNKEVDRMIGRLMNKLSESNMHKVSTEMQTLYQEYSSNDVSESLARKFVDICKDANFNHSSMISSLLACCGALMGFVYQKNGPSNSGVILETASAQLKQSYEASLTMDSSDSEVWRTVKNLVTLFAHFYSFGVICEKMMYDLLNLFCKSDDHSRILEIQIELILIIIQNCGYQLRKDNPIGLRDFILQLKTIPRTSFIGTSSRIEFMLEVIDDLKNNKQKYVEQSNALKPLRKWLQQCSQENFKSALEISWKDLMDIETNGRWWIVGSAWKGREKTENKLGNSLETDAMKSENSLKLEDLARQQRMNTECRKRIFCVVVGAQDYLDAFEKLLRLNLQKNDERELIRVIAHCAARERVYNPYYSHLAEKLCSYDRSHTFTLQLYFWDLFKAWNMEDKNENTTSKQCANLARLLSYLISKFVLSLSILKIVDFSSLNSQKSILFFHVLFKHLLSEPKPEQVGAIFQRVSGSFDLKSLRDGISFFFRRHFLAYYPPETHKTISDRVRLAENCMHKSSDFS